MLSAPERDQLVRAFNDYHEAVETHVTDLKVGRHNNTTNEHGSWALVLACRDRVTAIIEKELS